jgi:hypothetical protein
MPQVSDADTADRARGEVDVLLSALPTLRRRFPREIARTGENGCRSNSGTDIRHLTSVSAFLGEDPDQSASAVPCRRSLPPDAESFAVHNDPF